MGLLAEKGFLCLWLGEWKSFSIRNEEEWVVSVSMVLGVSVLSVGVRRVGAECRL